MKFFITTVSILAFIGTCLATAVGLMQGNFSSSCHTFYLSSYEGNFSTALVAKCDYPSMVSSDLLAHNASAWSELDLDMCLENAYGSLTPVPWGNFSWTCSPIGLEGVNFTADCGDSLATAKTTTFNLDDVVGSTTLGMLSCFDNYGTNITTAANVNATSVRPWPRKRAS
ncbi:hypothetical protein F5Y16DRAFT_376992 [Xylariaceae sp. FL0255]|nr:hypothetical protein F5Y16DRAFT_376992 [Xylariaceae sp. FL0255]